MDALTIERWIGEGIIKFAHIVLAARISQPPATPPKPAQRSNWFKLEVDELEGANEELAGYRKDITVPLVLQIYMQTSRAQSEPQLLEAWELYFSGVPPSQQRRTCTFADESKQLYHRLCVMARTLYSYVRVLPAYRLFRARQDSGHRDFDITYRISSKWPREEGGLLSPAGSGGSGSGGRLERFSFTPVEAKDGSLRVAVCYLPEITLQPAAGPSGASIPKHIITNYVPAPGRRRGGDTRELSASAAPSRADSASLHPFAGSPSNWGRQALPRNDAGGAQLAQSPGSTSVSSGAAARAMSSSPQGAWGCRTPRGSSQTPRGGDTACTLAAADEAPLTARHSLPAVEEDACTAVARPLAIPTALTHPSRPPQGYSAAVPMDFRPASGSSGSERLSMHPLATPFPSSPGGPSPSRPSVMPPGPPQPFASFSPDGSGDRLRASVLSIARRMPPEVRAWVFGADSGRGAVRPAPSSADTRLLSWEEGTSTGEVGGERLSDAMCQSSVQSQQPQQGLQAPDTPMEYSELHSRRSAVDFKPAAPQHGVVGSRSPSNKSGLSSQPSRLEGGQRGGGPQSIAIPARQAGQASSQPPVQRGSYPARHLALSEPAPCYSQVDREAAIKDFLLSLEQRVDGLDAVVVAPTTVGRLHEAVLQIKEKWAME